jgi:TetR/AcrR family transcriptional regulator, transcriptional repressor for nem operon
MKGTQMARPVEFDPEEALGAATRVFASHGYEGSSTAELLARMGIARQSLYGAFGDKRRLFLKALERYNAASVAEFVAALGSKRDRLDALEAALLAFAKLGAEPDAGCLGLGSITEFGRSDAEINAINDASARTLLTALATHIRDGVATGEMGDVDPQEAAYFLLAVRSGLKVAARSGAGFDALRAIARMALRSLRA